MRTSPSARGTVFESANFLTTRGAGREVLSLPRRSYIYRQGDRANSIYYLLHGRVKLCATSPVGKEAVVAVLSPGELFGEACLAQHRIRNGSAFTITPCQVVKIERDAIVAAIRKHPDLSDAVLRAVLRRTAQYEDALLHQLFDNSERRLARVLMQLAGYTADGHKKDAVIRHISQATLAEMVGTTRPRINGFMNKFRRDGHIDYREGAVLVHPSLIQVVMHEDPNRARNGHHAK